MAPRQQAPHPRIAAADPDQELLNALPRLPKIAMKLVFDQNAPDFANPLVKQLASAMFQDWYNSLSEPARGLFVRWVAETGALRNRAAAQSAGRPAGQPPAVGAPAQGPPQQ